MTPPVQPPPVTWRPPSDHLRLRDGLWRAESVSPVAYPEAGNEICYQVEDESYWFRHRMDCIRAVVRQFPPAGTLYDIGGGNGYVAAALQAENWNVALVEPGNGARNALRRGVGQVIWATLEDARLYPQSLPAAGAFDVLEHISDDLAFLRRIRASLRPGGRFYCTVPAFPALWSDEDVHAGHSRRYTRQTIIQTLNTAGFTVEFSSYFFAWLTLPVFLLRALPTRLRLGNKTAVRTSETLRADHHLPALLSGLVGHAHEWELARLRARRPLPFGSSLLCVAHANLS